MKNVLFVAIAFVGLIVIGVPDKPAVRHGEFGMESSMLARHCRKPPCPNSPIGPHVK